MSLIDMSQFDRVQIIGDPATVSLGSEASVRRRPPAPASGVRRPPHRDDLETDLAGLGFDSGESVVALRSRGPGDLVLVIAGPVDRVTARRVGVLLRDVRPHSTRGLLVVVLTRLGRWDPHLARVLGRARIHHLIDGGHLELHDAPSELLTALDQPPASQPLPGLTDPFLTGPHPERAGGGSQ